MLGSIKKKGGFSLLEMLLAISLMVSISALLGTIIFQTSKNKEISSKLLKNLEEKQLLTQLLQYDFGGIIFPYNFATKNKSSGLFGRHLNDFNKDIDQIYMHVSNSSLQIESASPENDPLLHEVYYVALKNFGENELYSLYRIERFYIADDFVLVDSLPGNSIFNNPDFKTSLVHPRIVSISFNYISDDPKTENSSPTKQWATAEHSDGYKLPSAILVNIKFINNSEEEEELTFNYNLRPKLVNAVWLF